MKRYNYTQNECIGSTKNAWKRKHASDLDTAALGQKSMFFLSLEQEDANYSILDSACGVWEEEEQQQQQQQQQQEQEEQQEE